MSTITIRQLKVIAWGISAATAAVAFVVWGQGIDWRFSRLSTYRLFPLFGLLAFSLMWTHYIAAALRQYLKLDKRVLHTYFEVTSIAVLAAILLHPGLLAWQLWRDGAGLPPGSELDYVRPSLKSAVVLGMVSWLVFLAYEFRRKFKNRSWWKFVQYSSDVAMLLIFIHGLRLGGQLRSGWFRGVWFFYGATLVLSLVSMYTQKYKQRMIAK